MKIQMLNGGLGNQMFQYIFARFVELTSKEPCYLDDSAFWLEKVEHNGFELKHIFPNIKLNLLSNKLDKGTFANIITLQNEGIKLYQQLKNGGQELLLVVDFYEFCYNGNVIKVPCETFMPTLAFSQGNIYFGGYWGGAHWFQAYENIIREELLFTPLSDAKNIEYQDKINQCVSVAVHIRRGDFLSLNWEMPESYYNTAIKRVYESFPEAVLFIFSDDMDYCRKHAVELGLLNSKQEPIYVEGNVNGNNYIDMQLMSQCKGMILCRSSFSSMAAVLNKDPDKLIIKP